jgi:hypothetical protein
MAMGSVQSGQFVIGLVLGLAIVLLTGLATLYELGYFPAQAEAVESVPAPKPTAAWRFRSEWLTPQPK